MAPAAAPPPQLDLSALTSYSPSWPHTLRFALCIATQYSARRCVERVRALQPNGADAAAAASDDDDERDEEGNVTSRLQGWAQERVRRKRRELVEDWEDYSARFLTAVCQHLGIPEEVLPPGETTLADVMNAARGRPVDENAPVPRAPEYELGTSHAAPAREGTGKAGAAHQADERARDAREKQEESEKAAGRPQQEQPESPHSLPPEPLSGASDAHEIDVQQLPDYLKRRARVSDDGTEALPPVSADDSGQDSGPHVAESDPANADIVREGGALSDEGKGREVEVVNELLLVALGLGQYRAEDGNTTVFESGSLFDDEVVPPAKAKPAEPAPAAAAASNAGSRDTARSGEVGAQLSEAGTKTWSAIRGGATSSWRGITTASTSVKDLVSGETGPKQSQHQRTPSQQKPKAKSPTKPNDVCHYDARGRALIWVAATSMGIRGMDVMQAEKVIAQSVYFIMSEGQRATKEAGQKDPLASLPAGANVDPRTGEVVRHDLEAEDEEQSSGALRKEWMNSASSTAVAREKGRGNWGRWAATGAGFALAGVALGVSGGLAAPLVLPALAGLTGVGFLATTGGVIMLGALFGLSGGGLAAYRVTRRLRGLSDFSFEEIKSDASQAGVSIPSLHATICCSGIIREPAEQIGIWQTAFKHDARDVYAISTENEAFARAGKGLESYMMDTLIKTGGQKAGTEVLKRTALAGFAAITIPLTVWNTASTALDSSFVQAKTRAHKAGLILADVLRARVQGSRPVILVGTSLGCATILTALLELAKDPANANLVSDVFLIGAPMTPSPSRLRKARSIVARRFVNAYSSKDMVCRIASWLGSGITLEELRAGQMPRVMGSCAVLGCPGVENVDLSYPSHFALSDAAAVAEMVAQLRVISD